MEYIWIWLTDCVLDFHIAAFRHLGRARAQESPPKKKSREFSLLELSPKLQDR